MNVDTLFESLLCSEYADAAFTMGLLHSSLLPRLIVPADHTCLPVLRSDICFDPIKGHEAELLVLCHW